MTTMAQVIGGRVAAVLRAETIDAIRAATHPDLFAELVPAPDAVEVGMIARGGEFFAAPRAAPPPPSAERIIRDVYGDEATRLACLEFALLAPAGRKDVTSALLAGVAWARELGAAERAGRSRDLWPAAPEGLAAAIAFVRDGAA